MREHRHPLAIGILIAIVIVGVQALLVPLFAGPAANIAPRDLPIAVAAPPPMAQQLTAKLEADHPGAFEIKPVADAAAVDEAIKTRAVYGGILLSPSGPAIHVASAASPTVANLLTQAAAGLGTGQPAPVTDVVPVHSGDPRGAGFGAGFLPLAMTGLIAGVLIFLLVGSRAARLTALILYAAGAGFAGAAVLQFWLDVLPGDYLTDAGVLALFALAVAATITGLGALLGRAGLALGVVLVFLVGNALSAVGSAPELLPQPWGAYGQWLPIGSGGTMLRSVAYFDGNGSRTAATVLTAYAVIGLLLALAGRSGLTRRTPHDAPDIDSKSARQHALTA